MVCAQNPLALQAQCVSSRKSCTPSVYNVRETYRARPRTARLNPVLITVYNTALRRLFLRIKDRPHARHIKVNRVIFQQLCLQNPRHPLKTRCFTKAAVPAR